LGGKSDLLSANHVLGKVSLLFDKIEDDAIDVQLQKLQSTKAANEASVSKAVPQKPSINYDQFSEMDIRVGTILEAERVPKTQKLLKLKVDTGIDVRTLVSGIAEYFSPEDAIGKQVAILVNLEPRKIRGIESHGMILMAENSDGHLQFVVPADKVDNGSTIK